MINMTEKIKIIVSLVSALVPLISIITGLIIKFAKTEQAKKLAKQLNFWTTEIGKYVVEAEKFLNYKGLEKKEYVLTKVNQACLDNKVKYDLIKVSEILEDVVKITKQVNQKEKDKGGELK